MKRTNRVPALVMVSLLLPSSVIFAISYSTEPPPPGLPPVDALGCLQPYSSAWSTPEGITQCYAYQNLYNSWQRNYSSIVRSVSWWKVSGIEIAQGLAATFGFFLISLPTAPVSLNLRNRPHLRPFGYLMIPVGLGYFAFAAVADLLYIYGLVDLQVFNPAFTSGLLPVGAGVGLITAGMGVGLLKLKEGLPSAFSWAVLLMSLAVSSFEVGLLVFGTSEMVLYMTTFSKNWAVSGVPVVSNWFALIISLGLASIAGRRVR